VRAAELAPQDRADLMARRRGRDDLRLAERVRRDPPRRDPRRDVRLADAVAGLHRGAAVLHHAVGDLALHRPRVLVEFFPDPLDGVAGQLPLGLGRHAPRDAGRDAGGQRYGFPPVADDHASHPRRAGVHAT
jgi:hypothetical protein